MKFMIESCNGTIDGSISPFSLSLSPFPSTYLFLEKIFISNFMTRSKRFFIEIRTREKRRGTRRKRKKRKKGRERANRNCTILPLFSTFHRGEGGGGGRRV